MDRELQDVVSCPRCKGGVRLTAAGEGLVCDRCRLLYQIREGIPIMLPDQARPITEDATGPDSP